MKPMNNLSILEQKIVQNLDLIDIAKKYCLSESENSESISSLSTLIEIISINQQDILRFLDNCAI